MTTTNPPASNVTPPPGYTFEPAKLEDVPILADMHVVACMRDNLFRWYFSRNQVFYEHVRDMLKEQIGEPGWTHVVVREVPSFPSSFYANTKYERQGNQVGWASWVVVEPSEPSDGKGVAAVSDSSGTTREGFTFPAGLAAFVARDSGAWMSEQTQGKRHISLRGLFMDPKHERKGNGTAFVRALCDDADAKGLPIYLWASAYGWRLYEREGFQCGKVLKVDLARWAEGGDGSEEYGKRNEGKGYGVYWVRYCWREPKAAAG